MASETITLENKNGGNIQVQSTYVRDDDAEYMGTVHDQREMEVLGKVQELRVRMPRSQSTNPPNDHV